MAKTRKPMSMGKFRQLVKAAVASPHVSRVRFFGSGNIPANATTRFPLLACDDDPDYDLATDGTNIAEVQPFSRITKTKLRMRIEPSGTGVAARCEWLLIKDPDQLFNSIPGTPASLFAADIGNSSIIARKYAIAYGWVIASTNRDASDGFVRINRKALKRAGLMHDGDQLSLFVTNSAAAATAHLSITGTITTTGR